jgi:hypothetical protein
MLIGALFVALSPALWSDPASRIGDLLTERVRLIEIQAEVDPLAPMTLEERVGAIVTQPFLAPVMHFEVASWGQVSALQEEIARYHGSFLAGYPAGGAIGVALTVAAGIGVIAVLRRIRQPLYAGLLLWLALTVVTLLANPLPWQRYYLLLIPIAALLAGLGLQAIEKRLHFPHNSHDGRQVH